MATVKDIIIDLNTGDLDIKKGDFVVRESDQQHQILIINTYPGNWKQHFKCGVGIMSYSASAGQGAILKRAISVQLDADGYVVNGIHLTEGSDGKFEYYIDATR